MRLEDSFFELIQVAIGAKVCLSHTPSAEERSLLYELAKKQSRKRKHPTPILVV